MQGTSTANYASSTKNTTEESENITTSTLPSNLTEIKPENIEKLDVSLDPYREAERHAQATEAVDDYTETFGSVDMEKSYLPLFQLLWYSQLPCTDVKGFTSRARDELSFIKRCYWKDKLVSCNAIFQKRPTDQGICCSFNMEKAETVLKQSNYTKAISMGQMDEKELGFEKADIPAWYLNNKEPTPEAGRKRGLKLILDRHSNMLSPASVTDNFYGFVTIVDEKNKYPMASLSKLLARPGFENNIDVTALQLQGKEEIRKYSPEKRKCYFKDEFKLEMHKFYSQSNCLLECRVNFARLCMSTCMEYEQECNCQNITIHQPGKNNNDIDDCVPWYFPVSDGWNSEMCNPWNIKKFQAIVDDMIPKHECDHCLPDCTTTVYDTSIAYAKFQKCDHTNIGTNLLCTLVNATINPSPWVDAAQREYEENNESVPWFLDTKKIEDDATNEMDNKRFSNKRWITNKDESIEASYVFPSELKDNPTYDAFEQDIGIINIFFSKSQILRYVTTNQMSEFDFLSQLGGTLGLAMGISFVSFVEFFYWFTWRLCRNFQKDREG